MRKPKKIKKLVGGRFEEGDLRKAFIRAGYRTWLIREYNAGSSVPSQYTKHYIEYYKGGNYISVRPFIMNRLWAKSSSELKTAIEDRGTVTLDNAEEVLGETLASEFRRVFQPTLEKLEEKLGSGSVWPWERVIYKVEPMRLM